MSHKKNLHNWRMHYLFPSQSRLCVLKVRLFYDPVCFKNDVASNTKTVDFEDQMLLMVFITPFWNDVGGGMVLCRPAEIRIMKMLGVTIYPFKLSPCWTFYFFPSRENFVTFNGSLAWKNHLEPVSLASDARLKVLAIYSTNFLLIKRVKFSFQ